MSLSSCLRKSGNLINKDDRLAIMSTAKNLRASGLDADEAGLQAITRQTEVVRAAIKAITGRDEPVRQLVAKPGADKPRGIGFDTTSASAAARSVSREKFNGNGAQVEIKEVDGGFDALINGERVGRLRDNLPRGAAEQLDENASVDIVKVDNEFKGQGVGSALYEAFNEKHGGRIAPSGKTSPEAWALWKRKFPQKVDAFVEAEAGRIRDGADPMMVVRNITDRDVARRVSEAAGDVVIRSAARQTETPEFKAWFGNSKVVDADGKPLVAYHGTIKSFDAFDQNAEPLSYESDRGKQFFLDNPIGASDYAIGTSDAYGGNANVIPVYLRMENPRIEEVDGPPSEWWDENGDGLYWELDVSGSGHDGLIVRGDGETMYVTANPNQIKSATGNRGAFDPSDANITRSLPRAIIAGDLGSLNNDTDYTASKSGDLGAALRLAGRVVDADLAEQLAGIEKPIVAGVVSIEASGRNAIPQAAAGVLASRLDGELDDLIIQSNAPKRTALGGLDRIFNRPRFIGGIQPGRNYILVDDTITQGGTFAALGRHIQAGGGNVAGVVALSGKQYSAILSVDKSTLNTLREKFGDVENEFEQATGYRYDDLTQSEARYLASFKPADAVRARILEGSGQGAGGDNQGAAGQEVTRSLPRPQFYSQLQRAIEQVPDRLATMAAPQWKLWLDANAPKLGVKKDEIEWSGVKDYLDLRGKGKVTRDELVAYLSDSGVRVQEVVLGNQTDRQKLSNEYDRAIAASDAAGGAMNPNYIESLAAEDRKPEEQAVLDAWNRVNENTEESWLPEAGNPKYGQYAVQGGENYREVLITLPSEVSVAAKIAALKAREISEKMRNAESDEEYEALRKERADLAGKAKEDPNYKSSHWDAPNVIAHIRVDDRVDADGKKILFVNELQSDFGQDYRKAKEAIESAVDADFQGIVERMKKAGVLEVVCD